MKVLKITVQFLIPIRKTFDNRHNLVKTSGGFFWKIKKETIFERTWSKWEPFYVIHKSTHYRRTWLLPMSSCINFLNFNFVTRPICRSIWSFWLNKETSRGRAENDFLSCCKPWIIKVLMKCAADLFINLSISSWKNSEEID